MPVKAYVWSFKSRDDPGHVALELSDKTYISWWPSTTKTAKLVVGKTVPDIKRSLSKDSGETTGEGRDPTHIFTLPDSLGLDEVKMTAWWERMKKEENYNLLFNNCSTAAKKALEAGGLNVDREVVETPNQMIEYFTKIGGQLSS